MELKERDIIFLKELYKNRIFGAGQAKRGYYGNMDYGYKRIRVLRELGYLDSEPYVEGRQKITEVYWITNKGIAELNLTNPRESHKNKPEDRYTTGRQLLINEIPVRFRHLENQKFKSNNREYIWKWLDSRETKEEYNINRGDIISGSLHNKYTSEEYAVYVPGATQNDEKQIEKHRSEVDRHAVLRNNIIFCTTAETFNKYRKMNPAGGSLKVLPFDEGIALIYNLLTEPEKLLELFSTEMHIEKTDIIENPTIFSTHIAGKQHLVELLTNDIVMQGNIAKVYLKNKKLPPLHILCWDTQLRDIKTWTHDERIKLYPLKWVNNPLFNGIDRSYRLLGRTRKLPDDKKKKHIGAKVPPELYAFIETVKNSTDKSISEILTDVLYESDLYKKYQDGNFSTWKKV